MGVVTDYFSAPSDEAAASALDAPEEKQRD
jgi:hypothetical protein